jgi:hypothetical protein
VSNKIDLEMKKIEFNDVDIETEEESENTNETYYK